MIGIVLDAVRDGGSYYCLHLASTSLSDRVPLVAGIALSGLVVEGLAVGVNGLAIGGGIQEAAIVTSRT